MEIISGADIEVYRRTMDETAAPFLSERAADGYLESLPGQRMYYEQYRSDNAKGVLVLVHGFSEAVAKYREVIYQFVKAGYHVWVWQQREHGFSYRSLPDSSKINITDFRQLIADLHAFVSRVVKADPESAALPLYLFGHSMGGGVCTCYAETYPDDFQKVILSSPMLQMKSDMPVWAASAYADVMKMLGKGTEGLPGAQPFSGDDEFETGCANCRARYLYYLERQRQESAWQMCVCTINTAKEFLKLTKFALRPENCRRIRANVLLLQACDDSMVGLKGQETFISRIGERGKLVRFEGIRHEIFMGEDSTQERYYREIFTFLEA